MMMGFIASGCNLCNPLYKGNFLYVLGNANNVFDEMVLTTLLCILPCLGHLILDCIDGTLNVWMGVNPRLDQLGFMSKDLQVLEENYEEVGDVQKMRL
ncbi:hypothetical protein L6452_43196 [Arctium lappa]|uniref:Uncharacterized protein n=1 Tax=Arctium lappa TaxID=4217 RepID=A0ACB8XKC9_ARCLA|nr:hypothetical protein L6452_43196 [Arctium lappa]